MIFALVAFGAVSGVELLLWLPPLWRHRKLAAGALLVLLDLTTITLLVAHPRVWTALIGIASAYRCLNLGRIMANRIQADYLYHASRQTSWWLIGSQIAVAGLAWIVHGYELDLRVWWDVIAGIELICAATLLASTLRHIRTTRPPKLTDGPPPGKLPALTVAIPARNETAELEACLESLIASTYPKLEIIVLDDCSQNKRTPEIIRGFAHAGVRFIAGEVPPEQWLAKNYAYKQLAEAANGELLLFCGVDVRFEPESLEALVRTLLQKQKRMISVMPRNLPPESHRLDAWFMQPNRYAWELSLPRRLIRRPPVLSTCWLITRKDLQEAGGFEAVRRKGVPESYLARTIAGEYDGYSFMRSDSGIGIDCRKEPIEQRATAIRTRYLQLHRRPELTAATSLAEFTLLIGPLLLLIGGLAAHTWLLVALAGLSLACNITVYSLVCNLAYRRFLAKGLWLLPLAALYDIGLLNYSMWLYEFREVLWKGRNVCIPVMRVIPGLPKST
ncbi:MAG TPA: glycosyltransferase family 2 protein [Verrucomicrobiae bacterium]|nr:glycosyltransferase family 2 protein [Verrucomicrobiae bacterium]